VLADEYQLESGECIPQDRRHVHTDFRDIVGFKPFVPVLGVHDESTAHAHDDFKASWEEEGVVRLRTKSLGKGIMISEIIFEKFRYLKIDDDGQYERFCKWRPQGHWHEHCESWADVRIVDGTCGEYKDYPLFLGDGLYKDLTLPPRESLLLFEYGKSNEGYFNTDHFVRSQFAALMLFEFLYPGCRLFAVYDNAAIHRSKGAYALDASIMNLSPGGKQRKQRATAYTDSTTGLIVWQTLVDANGDAKGLLVILRFLGGGRGAARRRRLHVHRRPRRVRARLRSRARGGLRAPAEQRGPPGRVGSHAWVRCNGGRAAARVRAA
jgi:hypothetical protein